MGEATADSSDRRRSQRKRPRPSTEVACRPEAVTVGPNLAVGVLDISGDGIRLVVRSPLAVGQKIEVDLDGIGYCRPLRISAEVVWSVPTADGNYCLGARF